MSKTRQKNKVATALVRILYIAYTLTPAFSIALGADETGIQVATRDSKKAAEQEQYERDVDQVALAAQDAAVSRLSTLLKKYRGTYQEPVLLAKLADVQGQAAAIHFRIAHGMAHRKGKGLDLSGYKKQMKAAIATLDTLIAKYPRYEEISHAYFMRGKGYEEIEDKERATRDYLHLVRTYPDSEDGIPAYMSLAEFAIGANDHARAIGFLKNVEKHTADPHYPFALYKLAWAHYNLKEIPAALSYAERQIRYYDQKFEHEPNTSEQALRDNTFIDTAAFFMEGFELKKFQGYQLSDALPYFRKLDQGPALGRVLARFAKLLRAHGFESDLAAYRDQILAEESKRPESVDILNITYEHQLNKRRFLELSKSALQLKKLYSLHGKTEAYKASQKLVLDSAEQLQQVVVKNKAADEIKKYSQALASLYGAFTEIVDEDDVRVPRVHYNLAETLFEIKDYEGATEHYRWVVDKARGAKGLEDSATKAIAARYEVLKAKSLIPLEIKEKSLSDDSDRKLESTLAEWIDWVDTARGKIGKKTEGSLIASLDSFEFEANRALYAQNHIKTSVKRLSKFATSYPRSKFSVPSATLVLDTLIASEDWDRVNETSEDLIETGNWKGGDFGKRLASIASDSYYKLIERAHGAKDYAKTLDLADRYLKKYPGSARIAETLVLAGAAAMARVEKDRALAYFSRIIKESPQSKSAAAALLERAQMEEDRYHFAQAAKDYAQYLALPAGISDQKADTLVGMRKKTLLLAWLDGDLGLVKQLASTPAVCPDRETSECERVEAWLAWHGQGTASEPTELFKKGTRGSPQNRPIWAVMALEQAKTLPFHDRMVLVQKLAADWDVLDAMTQYALLPRLSVAVPKAFALNRTSIGGVAPLRADEKHILRRVEAIKEVESAAAKALKLPWARVQTGVLTEMSGIYMDLANGLRGLAVPEGATEKETQEYLAMMAKISAPFEEKSQELTKKAREMMPRSAIADGEETLTAQKLWDLDPDGGWKRALSTQAVAPNAERGEQVKVFWSAALAGKRWQQVAFFLQEAQEKALLRAGVLEAVKAVSLASIGARVEAYAELESGKSDLTPEGRQVAEGLLDATKVTAQKVASSK